MAKAKDLKIRFWGKVSIRSKDECWPWLARKIRNGYGQFAIGKLRLSSHRMAYELFYGKSPDDLCVLHTCDNRECNNPHHLFLGTILDNIRDREKKGRTVTVKGGLHGRAKLSDDDVLIVKALLREGIHHKEIAKRFNVSKSAIHHISAGNRWKHI